MNFVFILLFIHLGADRGWGLQCYDCADTFKSRWNPYTACQANVSAVDVATCVESEKYCKVERVTVKGATIRITRSCARDCYYGCHLRGYGVTQLWCTSCCNQTLCNTGSGSMPVTQRKAVNQLLHSTLQVLMLVCAAKAL